jgi:hypothetical protein
MAFLQKRSMLNTDCFLSGRSLNNQKRLSNDWYRSRYFSRLKTSLQLSNSFDGR